MKKLFAALLALTMILGSMPVMADDPSLVTIGSGAEVLDSSAESIVPIGSGTTSDSGAESGVPIGSGAAPDSGVEPIVPSGSGATLDPGAGSGVPIGSGATWITPAPTATPVMTQAMPSREPGASDYGYLLPSGGTLYTGPGETTPVTTIDQNILIRYDGKPGYIAADGDLWVRVQVQISGQWGFVRAKSISFMSKSELNAPIPSEQETLTPAPSPTATPTPDPNVSLITPKPTESVIARATVTAAYGTLYKAPSTSAEFVCYIPKYATVDVLEYAGGWARVRYSGGSTTYTGYILQSSLTTCLPVPTAAPTWQPVQSYGYVKTTNGGGLNLREYASTSARRITTIPNNSRVEILSYGNTWSQVRYNGLVGYVMTMYLIFNPVAPTQQPGLVLQGYARVNTYNCGGLNMRDAAYSTANIVTTIPYNAQVEVYSYGATWSYVRYNGMFGYVMTAYLAFSYTPVPTATPAPTAPPVCVLGYAYVSTRSGGLNMREYASTAARVMMVIPRYARVELLTQGSTWCYVRYMGVYGYVMTRYLSTGYSPLPTAAPTSSTGAWATVATQSGGLNIREASYVGARILIVAPKGSTVTVVEHGTTWSRITYNGVTGYAMTGFLNFGGGSSSVTSTRAIASSSSGLKMYASTSTGGNVLCTIPYMTEVTVVSRGSRWTRVTWNYYTGYVLTSFLTFMPN